MKKKEQIIETIYKELREQRRLIERIDNKTEFVHQAIRQILETQATHQIAFSEMGIVVTAFQKELANIKALAGGGFK
jgi:hypothetical protein